MGKAALLVLAHGSAGRPMAPDAGLMGAVCRSPRLAQRFATVRPAFLRQGPSVEDAMQDLEPDLPVQVLPLFTGPGHAVDVQLPRRLAEAAPGRAFQVLPPVGCAPGFPGLICAEPVQLARRNRLDPARTALLLLGHGGRAPQAAAQLQTCCDCLTRRGLFAQVAPVFLEQAPYLRDWADLTDRPEVIIAPVLLGEGVHVTDDLPEHAASGHRPGRRLWITNPVGRNPALPRLAEEHALRFAS